jgi:nucleotide-binding universal stress UspA family protein
MKASKRTAEPKVQAGATSRQATPFRGQRILVPIDFSDPSRAALRYADSLARQFGGKLILLYALEPVATHDFDYHPLVIEPAEATAKAERFLRQLCEREKVDASSVAQIVVRNGVAHAEITKAVKDLNADLIVIATHGRTGLKHVLLGSTAERVVRHAECPVLVVRM